VGSLVEALRFDGGLVPKFLFLDGVGLCVGASVMSIHSSSESSTKSLCSPE